MGWSEEEQLYQLKLHLDKTALEVFQMLPKQERSVFESAITALKRRFIPADIEELRGLEFHHRTQGAMETIEKLGISIQQLGHKAFPTITGKEFDRLLKGRFYQALQVKWQRKLGCPKPGEDFHDLFACARMLEEHEKQYAASAVGRTDAKKASTGDLPKTDDWKNRNSCQILCQNTQRTLPSLNPGNVTDVSKVDMFAEIVP